MTRLEAEEISVQHRSTQVLSGVNFTVQTGQLVVVLGPNGAGKTTLLRALLGLASVSRGSLRVDGVPVRKLSGPARAAQLGWLPQRIRVGEALTAAELVAAARFRFPESAARSREAALGALGQVGLHDLADRRVDQISGGEAQRVALAALIAQDAEIWLADEPANHLDPAVQFSVYQLLRSQWLGGRGMVVVTHDVGLLGRLAPVDRRGEVRVIGLRGGAVAIRTHLDDPELPERLSELFQIRVRSVTV